MIKEVNPKEAFEILEKHEGAVLIDVRSTMEYEYVGHPLNALHVPIKEPPDWPMEANFGNNVYSLLKAHFSDNKEKSRVPKHFSHINGHVIKKSFKNSGIINNV